MIAAAALSFLLQANAASAAPAPPSFYRRWEDAYVQINVAQGRVCGRVARAREVAALQVRLSDFAGRARAAFGQIDQIVPLLEPERNPACDQFRPSLVHATRKMEEAEAFLGLTQAERRQ
jgi:hypothetical protein